MSDTIRTFETGATRDTDRGKPDYEAFLSPLVLEEYGRYMHAHRVQADGGLRPGDNWQRGIPIDEYMKSKLRHLMTTWKLHRAPVRDRQAILTSLMAELFNTMGMAFELLRSSNSLGGARENSTAAQTAAFEDQRFDGVAFGADAKRVSRTRIDVGDHVRGFVGSVNTRHTVEGVVSAITPAVTPNGEGLVWITTYEGDDTVVCWEKDVFYRRRPI